MDCQFDGGRIIQQLGSGYWQKPEDNLILLLAKSIHKLWPGLSPICTIFSLGLGKLGIPTHFKLSD